MFCRSLGLQCLQSFRRHCDTVKKRRYKTATNKYTHTNKLIRARQNVGDSCDEKKGWGGRFRMGWGSNTRDAAPQGVREFSGYCTLRCIFGTLQVHKFPANHTLQCMHLGNENDMAVLSWGFISRQRFWNEANLHARILWSQIDTKQDVQSYHQFVKSLKYGYVKFFLK